MRLPVCLAVVFAVLAPAGCGAFGSDEPADIQVYSARHYDLEEAFTDFTDETGLTVDFLYGDDAELLERLKAEGGETQADIYMTVDAGSLWNAADQGLFRSVESPPLNNAIPKDLRDSRGRWFGLAMRARTVMYNPANVDPAEFDTEQTYASLGDEKWRGRICMRDSTASYTQSLIASLIDLHGRERATNIVRGWVNNGLDIMSNDIELLEAIDAGGCDVGLTNHYYLARKIEEEGDFNVEPFWASQDGAGTHVNISGAGVLQASDNPDDAQQLIEWLATDGQNDFVDDNHEYPANPDVQPEELIAGFGEFKRMPIDAEAYGARNADAIQLMEEAGYR